MQLESSLMRCKGKSQRNIGAFKAFWAFYMFVALEILSHRLPGGYGVGLSQ